MAAIEWEVMVCQDLTANLGQPLSAYLKKNCDLKSLKEMVEEKERLNKQVVDDLVKTVDQKNDTLAASHHQFVVLRNMVREVDNLRVKAEEDKKQMEEQHKQGMIQPASQSLPTFFNAQVIF